MSDGGKGSTPRPMQVSRDQYSNNWDAIFKQAKELTKNIKLVNEEFNKEYDKLDKTK